MGKLINIGDTLIYEINFIDTFGKSTLLGKVWQKVWQKYTNNNNNNNNNNI